MSDLIHLLPDSVANQIAAGEVIQRPASVIKELVENSIDAGATKIHVIVVDAGRTSIQVIDDGKGMSDTDARLSFERHATSKISQAGDLFALRTMGFRGEALASIAAVAQVELQTRRKEDEVGSLVAIAGSKITKQEPVSCAVGSNFKVDNLFFNVPARRKFLKSNSTELNNILTAFERIVLVYPQIHFTLHHNGVEMLNLRAGSARQRIVDVFGKHYNQMLLPVEVKTAMCSISGFVGKPESARKKSGCDYFFVNGRFMKHAYFHKAVMKAYERLVPEGMAIPYFLYIEVEPSEIDVNIHPTKTEIKFENEQSIWQILYAAVRDGIGKFCEVPTIDFDTEGQPDIPVFDNTSSQDFFSAPKVSYNPDYNPFSQSSGSSSSIGSSSHSAPSQWESLFPQPDETIIEPQSSTEIISENSPAHYQYKGKYLMTAVKSGLMIIDQHRASVRILYDRYQNQQESRVINTQKLLFPETVQLSPSESVAFNQLMPELTQLGFDIADLGGNTFAVNGIPSGIEGINPQTLLRDMVADGDSQNLVPLTHKPALRLAQTAAVPYGQILSNDEMESIVNELFSCTNVNYTPDGKAILCILPQGDIEQLLG